MRKNIGGSNKTRVLIDRPEEELGVKVAAHLKVFENRVMFKSFFFFFRRIDTKYLEPKYLLCHPREA